jgi:hypothetical protein
MPPRRVSEASPIQVYLGPEEQERLATLAERLKTTKSDVVRRGLLALEQELGDTAEHPMLKIIGLIKTSRPDPLGSLNLDPARDHDAYLAEAEVRSWEESRKLISEKPPVRRRGR